MSKSLHDVLRRGMSEAVAWNNRQATAGLCCSSNSLGVARSTASSHTCFEIDVITVAWCTSCLFSIYMIILLPLYPLKASVFHSPSGADLNVTARFYRGDTVPLYELVQEVVFEASSVSLFGEGYWNHDILK